MTVIDFTPRLEAARRRQSAMRSHWTFMPPAVMAANFRLLFFPLLVAQLTLSEAARYLGTVNDSS